MEASFEGRTDVPGFGPVSTDDLPPPVRAEQPAGFTARLAAILVAVGYTGHGAAVGTLRKLRAGSPLAKKALLKARSEIEHAVRTERNAETE